MGDRANIRFKQADGQIYLYGHWAGEDLATEFQVAFVKAQGRWNDPVYCTAFCVGQILKTNGDNLTGYGLSTSRTDNERNCLEVDFKEQVVRLRSREGWHDEKFDWENKAQTLKEWTFAEFAKTQTIHLSDD